MIDILGCIATVVVVISFTVKDMGWLRAINATGAMLWLIYGGLRNDIPLLAVNIAILMAHIHWYYKQQTKRKITMAQQTAIDWLVNKIYMVIPNEERNFLEGLREQAKQMEKEQIIENNKLKAIVEFYEQGCGLEGCKVIKPHVH